MLRRVLIPLAGVAATSAACYTTLPNLKYPAALPKLPYHWQDGLKPVFSPRQMELHYTKHHKAYVDRLNTLGAGCEDQTIEQIIKATHGKADKKVMFNQAAQHFNHAFYWYCLKPNGSSMPAELKDAIAKDYGDVEAFKAAFQQAGANNFGSGWTWLCVDPASKKLVIHNTSNADCPQTAGLRPIFTADVWEHAYYKDYENRRPDYLKELWAAVNWEYVAEVYKKAIQ